MKRARQAKWMTILLAVGIVLLGAVPTWGATTWTVDNDPGAQFTSIQDAIDKAVSGDTIMVAPGLYEEIVTINESLTILGPTAVVNKNGYAVPVGYTWNTSVEAVIQPPAGSDNGDVVLIDDADDVTLQGFVIQALDRGTSGNRMLLHVTVDDKTMENLNIVNNVLGPNTNVVSQDGTKGRMNVDLDINPRNADQGLIDSLIAGNKIFGIEGNGNGLFVWGSYHSYSATGPSPMTGTVIEDNEFSNGHRAAIELCGGISGLVVRDNVIHDFSALLGDDVMLKYGQGITLIRGSGDRTANGFQPTNILIENNEIYNIEKMGILMDPNNDTIYIIGNNLHDIGWDAIRVDLLGGYSNPDFEPTPGPFPNLAGSQDVFANSNRFENNRHDVQVIGIPSNGFVLDASGNWWGTNDPAVIVTVVDPAKVDFSPILNSGADGDPSTPGWQPDLSSVTVHTLGQQVGATGGIQEGIDLVNSGGTVNVAAGTYAGNVGLGQQVMLLALPGAVINGGVKGITATSVNGVVINGFTIKDYSHQGIRLTGGSATISNNVIKASITPNSSYSEDSIYIKGNAAVTVSGNTLYNNHYTGTIYDPIANNWSTAAGLSVHDNAVVIAMYNSIYNNDFGIHVKHNTGTVAAHYNDIHGNTVYGFFFEGVGGIPSSSFDASLNWWGNSSGPSGEGTGTGDAVSTHVIFSPWLGIDPDGNPTLPGVQITGPMTIIVAPVGPEPTGGYLNTAIAGANSPDLPYTDTIEVRSGTYADDATITDPVTIESQEGCPATTFIGGNLVLGSAGIQLGTLRHGFTIGGNLTVGAGINAAQIHVNWNNIEGQVTNTAGIGSLDATYNFWGADGPLDNIAGQVHYYPYLPVEVCAVIQYMDDYGLNPNQAIVMAQKMLKHVSPKNILAAFGLVNMCGMSMDDALAMVREYGRVKVQRALRLAHGDCAKVYTQLVGYGVGVGGGAGGGLLDKQIAGGGGAIEGVTLEASYRQGDTIHVAFTLTDPITGDVVTDAVATLSVVRVDPTEFTYWGTIPYDSATGQYQLDYATSGLSPGYYDLYIGTSDGQTKQLRVEIVAP